MIARGTRRGRGRKGTLAVVDLETAHNPQIGSMTVAAIHRQVAPGAPLQVAVPGGPLEELRKASKVVVTGSTFMVADVPWAGEVADAVVRAAEAGVPVLAICFGHQLLARHFGGRLESFDAVQKAVVPIRFEAAGPFAAEEVPLVHTHRDYVAEPGSLVPCAQGGLGGIPALRHPDLPLWTVQGHPEWDDAIARADDPYWHSVPEDALRTPDAKGILTRFGAL